jgi:hypothetical protein
MLIASVGGRLEVGAGLGPVIWVHFILQGWCASANLGNREAGDGSDSMRICLFDFQMRRRINGVLGFKGANDRFLSMRGG